MIGMPKGPRLNKISKNFTTRDSLGIEGVATTMQGQICPIVNTVTPRAFYWPFMVWIYYDFYKHSGIKDHTEDEFDKYLKRQDYFFVLATLLTNDSDKNNLVGKQQSQVDIYKNQSGPYPFNPAYFKTKYGGMQYYNAGCLSMYFITNKDVKNDKDLSFPALRPEGERLAKAFEAVIKDTEYYKFYRRNDSVVPRSVLEEYGRVINLSMNGFDECKKILYHYMFEDDRASHLANNSALLRACVDYIKHIYSKGITELSVSLCRQLFFDHQLPSGEELDIPDSLLTVANKWELVIGRMYFTVGLEMLWKYMLEQLVGAFTLEEWIHQSIRNADFTWNLRMRISDVLPECNYDFSTREDMIARTAKRNTSSFSIENGMKIVLSIYNRFVNRNDLGDEKEFLEYGLDTTSISLIEFFDHIDIYKDQTIEEFMWSVLSWLVKQHYLTAFDKMMQGRDGFYYEIIDGRYIRKQEFGFDFQGIRMVQLAQVMKDLEIL